MTQMSLPLYNPQDRGRLNALQNILLAVSDELRQQEPVIGGIVDFTVNELPQILRQNTPLDILSATAPNPIRVSPYRCKNLLLSKHHARNSVLFLS